MRITSLAPKYPELCIHGQASEVCVDALVYARHGRDLMGCKSPIHESCLYNIDISISQKQEPAPDSDPGASPRGVVWRKLECKAMSRRTETAYKAKSPGKAAQDDKARDSGEAPVPVQAGSKCCGCTAKDHSPYPGRSVRHAFTSGESVPYGNIQEDWTEVSRGHSRRRETSSENPGGLTPPKG